MVSYDTEDRLNSLIRAAIEAGEYDDEVLRRFAAIVVRECGSK